MEDGGQLKSTSRSAAHLVTRAGIGVLVISAAWMLVVPYLRKQRISTFSPDAIRSVIGANGFSVVVRPPIRTPARSFRADEEGSIIPNCGVGLL
jgi:hypothetical protein